MVRHVEHERRREHVDALVLVGEQGDVEAAVAVTLAVAVALAIA